MQLGTTITVLPYLHGKIIFSQEVRRLCLDNHYDCITVDLPGCFHPYLPEAIEALPVIHALVARKATGPFYYLPADPCDATIEAVRQSFQLHIPFYSTGFSTCEQGAPLPELPDEYAAIKLGFDAFTTLCLHTLEQRDTDPIDELHGRCTALKLRELQTRHRSILALVHLRHIRHTVAWFKKAVTNSPFPVEDDYDITGAPVNPDHLYFALGQLPFITGKYEQERYNIFSGPFDAVTVTKELFRETRDHYSEEPDEIITLSPVRIQAALTFLRNLTVLSDLLLPSLFDIVEAAKGVGGNTYGLHILKGAKYYPYFSLDDKREMLGIGTRKMRVPAWRTTAEAINLFRDHSLYWRTLPLRPDPSEARKKKYRYHWNPYGMCSHVPEDITIERFNGSIRHKARKILLEDLARTEKFTTSVKDGIDIRETLRNWHTGGLYVRELPPAHGNIDTVIIIFDEHHDDRYPNRTTWYAEHTEESTLTFYATDPFENLIGPGIARCSYGGLSLLFPPRPVPDVFHIDTDLELRNCAARITFGGLLFSKEDVVAYVADKRPAAQLTNMARLYKKRLLWIPLSTFSHETVRKLRQFHILNGKDVRSWATRFIGD
jgi:hypothetical protein